MPLLTDVVTLPTQVYPLDALAVVTVGKEIVGTRDRALEVLLQELDHSPTPQEILTNGRG